MKIHHLTVEEAFAGLRSGPEGLPSAEAARRLTEYGPNAVENVRGEPLTLRFLKGFMHFFAIVRCVAYATEKRFCTAHGNVRQDTIFETRHSSIMKSPRA
jgi:hypothetical protein